MDSIDLTGVEVKVLGNRGDVHLFRLSNPVGQEIIGSDGQYDAEFISHLGEHTAVILNTTEIATGTLIIPVAIENGKYKVRRLDPRRTIITIEVQSQ